ncbi:hypothetical protein AB1N83_005855 [Pleurotus pulmonarius]
MLFTTTLCRLTLILDNVAEALEYDSANKSKVRNGPVIMLMGIGAKPRSTSPNAGWNAAINPGSFFVSTRTKNALKTQGSLFLAKLTLRIHARLPEP